MKRKTAAILLTSALTAAMCGGSASAMTYGYDVGDKGKVIYIYQYPDEAAVQETESEIMRDSETTGALTEAELSLLNEKMKEEIAYLASYGVTWDEKDSSIVWRGKKVRWLTDQQADGTMSEIRMSEGETDLYVARDEAGALTGVREATPEEFARRTKEDEEQAKLEERTFAIDGQYGTATELVVVSEDVDSTSIEANQAEVTITSVVQEGDTLEESAENKARAEEYEKFGITQSSDGGFLWHGTPVRMLLDEDGCFYQNGSSEAKKEKVYILVKRDGDGGILEVKQITSEEVLKEEILRDIVAIHGVEK